MQSKFCPDCRRELPVSAFTKNRANKDRLAFYCAQCARARHVASRRRRFGPPRTRNGQGPANVPDGAKWCPECDRVKPETDFSRAPGQANGRVAYCMPCFNAIKEANRKKNHGSTRNYHLRHRYGITVDDFDHMFAEQDGVCAICRAAPAAHVDHDHDTGRVRGLLCFNCNGALGQFRDRTELMLRAVAYLHRGSAARFVDVPATGIGWYVGPESDRPPGESFPAA